MWWRRQRQHTSSLMSHHLFFYNARMQAAGFYHNMEMRPSVPYRNYNTWMGDPTRAMQAREILQIIKRDKLVENTAQIGSYMYKELAALMAQNSGAMYSLRGEGQGTFIAWDAASPAKRDELLRRMRARGIHVGGCGEQAIRLRPMLVFQRHHADLFLEHLAAVLKEV